MVYLRRIYTWWLNQFWFLVVQVVFSLLQGDCYTGAERDRCRVGERFLVTSIYDDSFDTFPQTNTHMLHAWYSPTFRYIYHKVKPNVGKYNMHFPHLGHSTWNTRKFEDETPPFGDAFFWLPGSFGLVFGECRLFRRFFYYCVLDPCQWICCMYSFYILYIMLEVI